MGMDVALLYNRIGKRIIGVGRSEGTTGSEENARVPHSYEMPRDAFDITMAKRWGNWELRLYVRDLLNQYVTYRQFANVTIGSNAPKEVKQITRRYKPGRNIGLTLTLKL